MVKLLYAAELPFLSTLKNKYKKFNGGRLVSSEINVCVRKYQIDAVRELIKQYNVTLIYSETEALV